MGEEVRRLAGLLCTQPRHRESYVAVDPERFARLEGETSRFFVPQILGIQVVADATVAPDVVELRDKYDKVLIGFGGVSSPKAQTATESAVKDFARRHGLAPLPPAPLDDMNPRWSSGPAVEAVRDFTGRDAERMLAPPRDVDAPFQVLAERMRAICEKHGLLPTPPPSFEGIPVRNPSAETIQREKDERREQLRGPDAESLTGAHCWECACGAHGCTQSETQSREALNVHLRTVEHDRATEKRLRKQVETAREALYDYLKGKGRVA